MSSISRITLWLKFHFILNYRRSKLLLFGPYKKVHFALINPNPVLFKNSILILEFNTKGIYLIKSNPGYPSIDLKRMYLDLAKIDASEIIVTAYGLFKKKEIAIDISKALQIKVEKHPTAFRTGFFNTKISPLNSELLHRDLNLQKTNLSLSAKRKTININIKTSIRQPKISSWNKEIQP